MLLDTAGLRTTDDPLEIAGIERGTVRAAAADLVIDLGPAPRADAIAVAAQSDRDGRSAGWRDGVLHLSAHTGEGLDLLRDCLTQRIMSLTRPLEPPVVAHQRQVAAIKMTRDFVVAAMIEPDQLLIADNLRAAAVALATTIGGLADDALLDEIFARFCIGK